MSKTCLNAVNDYSFTPLYNAVKEQFDILKPQIKPGMNVVIKPNLVIRAKSDSAIITHPNLVAAVGTAVKEMGANVIIAESSGGLFTPSVVRGNFKSCGYEDIANQYGFTLYTQCEHESVELKHGVICRRLNIIKPYINADFIINIAKLKSHCMTTYSGAIKNLFGVVPGLMKPELHARYPDKVDFAHMLLDLCEHVRPNLSIIDAIEAMEGDGPTSGKKRFVGALIASKSPYFADLVGSSIANMKVNEINMLRLAVERKLCPKDSSEIEIFGDKLSSFIQHDFLKPSVKSIDFADKLPKFIRPLARKVSTPLPKIKKKKCVGCGKCAESCPKKIIKIEQRLAKITYTDCIKCFCCHEMCPYHAIDIKRLSLFNL